MLGGLVDEDDVIPDPLDAVPRDVVLLSPAEQPEKTGGTVDDQGCRLAVRHPEVHVPHKAQPPAVRNVDDLFPPQFPYPHLRRPLSKNGMPIRDCPMPPESALSWKTDTEKKKHKGDLWYSTTEQKSYIFSCCAWESVKTEPPSDVYDSIDGKAQIFVSTPTVPYAVGDLWFNDATADILTCIKDRDSGSFTVADWQKRN